MQAGLATEVRTFYTRTLTALNTTGIPYLVGGAYALQRYTDVERHTKDFDLFIRRADLDRILQAMHDLGCRTEVTFPHWLAKAYRGDHFFDVIFSSGNGMASVDDDWFRHGVEDTVLDVPVRLVPAEEMIWQKAFIMERERFDGADIAHLIRARGGSLDWPRLLRRFDGPRGPRTPGSPRPFRLHLSRRADVHPRDRPLRTARPTQGAGPTSGPAHLCRGPLLSRAQYLPDIGWWGYDDARLEPDRPIDSRADRPLDRCHRTSTLSRRQSPGADLGADDVGEPLLRLFSRTGSWYLQRGDVILARVPHVAGTRGKKRPAVIIQSDAYNAQLRHAVVAEVTSNPHWIGDPACVVIDLSTPEGQARRDSTRTRSSLVSTWSR